MELGLSRLSPESEGKGEDPPGKGFSKEYRDVEF